MTDVELVPHALAGDREALEHLYQTYSRFVLNQARRFGADDDAEDVVQTMFAQLAEGTGWHIRPEASPEDGTLFNYLTKATRHSAMPRRWRRKYQGPYPEVEGDVVPLWAWRHESPEERVLRLERTERLRWALGSLPQRLRQVAQLRYIECLSGPEIAARLGLKPKSIPTYLLDIRERLRPALAVVYQLPPRGRYGFVRFDRSSANRARTASQINLNAKRRRERAKARRAGHALATVGN